MIIKRPITEEEREKALNLVSALHHSIDPRREFISGLMFGLVVSTFLGSIAIYVFQDHLPKPLTGWIFVGGILVWGVRCGLKNYRNGKKTIAGMAQWRQQVEEELEKKTVREHRGKILRSRFLEEDNPEHPDLLIELEDGENIRLDMYDQSEIETTGKLSGFLRKVVLPESELTVLVEVCGNET